MVNNFFVKCLLFVCFLVLPFKSANSAEYTTTGSVDFGVIMQNSLPSVIPVTSNGQRDEAGTQGVYKAQNPTVSNVLKFTSSGWGGIYNDKIRFPTNQTSGTITDGGCTFEISNLNPNENEIFMSDNAHDFYFSLTLSISNFCTPDVTYSGTFNVTYEVTSCLFGAICGSYTSYTIPFQYSFKIEEPLGADEIQPLNFGAIMPILDGTGTVTIAPEDESVSVTGDIKYFYSGYSRGIYQIYGIGNRMVNITMPSSVTISNITENNGDTMIVDNFKVSSTFAYTQTSDGAKVEIPLNDVSFDSFSNFFVGATLHVGAGVSAGTYRGEYTILLSY